MDLRSKRALDHRIGQPVLFCLSPLVRLLGVLLGRSHAVLPVRTVVILKFQGMGSIAIAKPAIARLRARFPEARLVFWGTPGTCALAGVMPEFDELLVFDDRSLGSALVSLARNLGRLLRLRADWAVDLEVYSKLSVILCTLTGARNRAGFAVDSVRMRRRNHTHLLFFNRRRFLGEAYERLFALIAEEPWQPRPRLAHQWSEAPIASPLIPAGAAYVVVNPNAGELCLERRWPRESFARLIAGLLEQHPEFRVLLIGSGPAELEYCRPLLGDERVIDAVNQLNLAQTVQALADARLVVSNDSAPLHIALQLEVAVVALFGPTQPATYLDLERPRLRVHYSGIYCSPCLQYWDPPPCGGFNRCMQGIPVAAVARSCGELLAGGAAGSSLVETQTADDARYFPGLVYAKGP